MQYDANGLRIGKTRKIASNTTNSTYVYDSEGKLRTEIAGNATRNYIYGQDGVVGYEENGEHFMYRKNFFGDITAIYQGTTKIAEYSYDAWGNGTVVSDYNGYGARNPFRYRGYYFDTDLNMYYLMTRYYDPQTGRFINADTIEYLDPEAINGLNLYAYCNSNPVMNTDSTGCNPILFAILTTVIVAIGAVVGAVLGANLSENIEGNIDATPPGNPTEVDENKELTTTDITMNSVKGAFLLAHSTGVAVSGVGAIIALCGDVYSGAQLYVWGSLYATLFGLLLIPFGIEVQSPELDPSDIYQPNLPNNK